MQMNALQRLDELIEESREIETQAERLQAGGPLNSATPYAVQQFQERYRAWYANTLELLPSDLRKQFKYEQTGPEGDCGQVDFVAEPTGTGQDQRQVYDARVDQAIDPTKFRYTYTYERCFRVPLLRQRRILMEATHRTDLARHHRVDEHGAAARLDFHELHPKVVAAGGRLFADGHFRNAILEACTALSGAVREKSEVRDRDGTKLMEHVFSPKKPILWASENEDERKGVMWLFTGAVMGLRNPRAHHLREGEDLDATEAFEWLAFVSALMRMVDRAEIEAYDDPGDFPKPSLGPTDSTWKHSSCLITG